MKINWWIDVTDKIRVSENLLKTIHKSRQQKGWVGAENDLLFAELQYYMYLLFMLTNLVGAPAKAQKCADFIYGW